MRPTWAGRPLSTTEVVERIIVERGLDAEDRAVWAAMVVSVGRALRYQRERDAVRNPCRDGRTVLWELAG